MSADTATEVGRLYRPIKQIADVLTAGQQDLFIQLPGLRGYWPMSAVDFLGNAKDHSGASSDLAGIGSTYFSYDGNANVHTGPGTDYLAGSVSAQRVLGTEAWIDSSLRGLTVGGWVKIDALPAVSSGIIGQSGDTPNRSWTLRVLSTGQPSFFVSGTGAAVVDASGVAVATGVWHFFAGRFIPSTEVAVFANGDKTVNTTAVPASLFTSTQAFEIGRYFNNNTLVFHGAIRDAFLCATALSDELIEQVRLSSTP